MFNAHFYPRNIYYQRNYRITPVKIVNNSPKKIDPLTNMNNKQYFDT